MSTGAQPASGIAKYRILRELGARSQRSYAAIREPHELVVVHRFVKKDATPADGALVVSPEELGFLLRDAQCLAKNWHPNIARIKHVDLVGGELTIASELVDGSTLGDLTALVSANGGSFPLDVLVRVLLDVLAGIHGIHGLRDGRNVPIGAIHGEVCPANIVVGRDGVARIVNALRPRPLRIAAGSEAVGYAAPETLDGGVVDARADVHAVGVILWEALCGKRLHDETDPVRLLSRQRETDIPVPVLPPGSPYGALAEIAMRALSFDPALRFRTAAGMASELRKLPAARIATGSVVASRVLALDGERIRGRRAALDPTASGGRRRVSQAAIAAAQAKVAAASASKVNEPAPSPAAAQKALAGAPPRPAALVAPAVGAPERGASPPVEPAPPSEPPGSIELEEIPASAPDTVRQDQRAARQPPPVPPRAAPPKPAPRQRPTAANEQKAASAKVAAAPRPASSPAIDERVTISGAAPPVGASSPEERLTVPGSPVGVGAIDPSVDDRVTVLGAAATTRAPATEPTPVGAGEAERSVLFVSPPAPEGAAVGEPPRDAVLLGDGDALESLARSTASAVADEPGSSGKSLGAGVTAAGIVDSRDDVEVVPPIVPSRRRWWLALAAVLLLGGAIVVIASRSRPESTAGQGPPVPSTAATLTTAPLTAPHSPAPVTGEPATTSESQPVPTSAAAISTGEPSTPPTPPAGSTSSVRSEPPASVGGGLKPAPRPTSRRYEPLGI